MDCPNFQDNEFDGTVEEESAFWVSRKSAKLLSDNVMLFYHKIKDWECKIFIISEKLVNNNNNG